MGQKHVRSQRVVDELEGIDLGDPRRGKRARTIAQRVARRPDESLPSAMLDDAELEAAYRHLSSEAVTLEDIVAPHVAKTRARVEEEGEALALHDTVEFTFGGEAVREGLGVVQGGDQGFLAHLSLAVSHSRVPLGLLAVGTRVREEVGAPTGQEREKWRLGITQASQGLDRKRLIHVADREGDIYALFVWLVSEGHRFIIRAAQNRSVLSDVEGAERLFDAVTAATPMHKLEVQIGPRRHGGRSAKDVKRFPVRRLRTAKLAFSARTVTLHRPARGATGMPATLSVNVVRAWEPEPPLGEQGIEWILFTSEPIDTPDAVTKVVESYRARWMIEEFNMGLKTGCAYEESQLESAHALFNLLGYCLLVAYALLLLRALSRNNTRLPATHFLSTTQLTCLKLLSKRVKLSDNPSLEDALLACAGLGGHLKRNGLPGWRTLSAGYSRLLEFEAGFLAGQQLTRRTSDQS